MNPSILILCSKKKLLSRIAGVKVAFFLFPLFWSSGLFAQEGKPYYQAFQLLLTEAIMEVLDKPTDVVIDRKGFIWIGTANGLVKYDGKSYQVFQHEIGNPNSLSYNEIDDLEIDQKGNIWIATRGGGVNYFIPETESFKVFKRTPLDTLSLFDDFVSNIFIDNNHDIYFSHPYQTGISKYLIKKQHFIRLESKHQDRRIPISKIYQPFNNDKTLFLTGGESLFSTTTDFKELNLIHNSIEQANLPDYSNPKHFERATWYGAFQEISSLYYDGQKTLWFGTKGKGLKNYHLQTGIIKSFLNVNNHPFLSFDKDKNQWLLNAANQVDLPDQAYEPAFIRDMHPLNDSLLLLACNVEEGLHIFNMKTHEFSKLKNKRALIQTDINLNGVSIIPDRYGHLWILSEKRSINQNVAQSILLLTPNEAVEHTLPIRFLDLKVNGEVRTFDKKLPYKNEVKLEKGENNVTIKFVFLNYLKPEDNIYYYRLKGYESEWRSTNQLNNFASYDNLRSGTYTLQVKAENSTNNYKSELGESLKIIIPALWYRTYWAKGILFLLIGSIILGFMQLQRRRVKFQAKLHFEQQEAQRLRALDKLKSALYTNITHEFRTPLSVIQGMTDTIAGNETAKEIILRNSRNLLNMVNQMLDLAKLESANLTLHLRNYDIIPFLHYQTEAWSSFANIKKISLNFYSKHESLSMDFDKEKLEQVMSNLISNAIKFTPEFGKIQVVAEEENGELIIIIKDTGKGIAEVHLAHIFDRFYQADTSMTRKEGGTGIGLAVVKELVKPMKGRIEVSSKVNKGTTFKIWLPICQKAEKENWEVPSKVPNDIAKLANHKSIIPTSYKSLKKAPAQLLVIEDNQDVITYIKTCLGNTYEITTAKNGKEGLLLANELLPDIILSDVMMPEMDGFEACKRLKENRATSHIPIILLTAKASQQAKVEGLSYGADAYLTKPFHQEELLVRLEKMIELRRKLHAKYAYGSQTFEKETIIISKRDQAFLDQLKSFLLKHIAEDEIDVNRMARSVHLSRSQLHKKLKALTGLSASQYRRLIRLKEAKQLLRSKKHNVSEVAYQVGYAHPSNFSKDYKRQFGISPKEDS